MTTKYPYLILELKKKQLSNNGDGMVQDAVEALKDEGVDLLVIKDLAVAMTDEVHKFVDGSDSSSSGTVTGTASASASTSSNVPGTASSSVTQTNTVTNHNNAGSTLLTSPWCRVVDLDHESTVKLML